MFKSLYNYRELLKSNVKKEIRGKYKGSFLGVLWSFVNPLLMAIVYAIVFPIILKNSQDNYVTFIVLGILPWNFFTTVISQGTYCIIANAGIIKKVYFPREILPISIATSGLINFLISTPIMFMFLIFSGIGLSWYILLLPIIALIQYLFSLGIIMITSSINVYIRDFEYIINFFVTMLFYATPILYSADMFANSKISWIIALNPMAGIVTAYRDIMFYQKAPDVKLLTIILLISLSLFIIGKIVFSKLERGFAEEV